MFGWFLALGITSFVFFLAYIIFSIRNYKYRFKENYDIRNHFPYEFNYESKFTDNILGNICLTLSLLFSLALYAMVPTYKNNNGMLFVVLITGIILTISVCLINFVPLKLLKSHLVCSVILFVSAFMTPASIGLTALKEYQEFKEVTSLVMMIVALTFALFCFVLVMNPRLSLKIKMITATNEKGEEIYVRPKYIVYAFSEWMMTFILMVSNILLIFLLMVL